MTSSVRDFRGVGKPVGAVVMGLGVVMGLCAGVAVVVAQLDEDTSHVAREAWALGIAAGITATFGGLLVLYGRPHARDTMNRREAVLSVALIWVATAVFAALPFVLGAQMGPADAIFESVSGLTTTGATVITNIEGTLHQPLLLWRSLTQWLGGMGIVVLFVAVFPSVGAGGKHMFRGEVPGTTAEDLKPRIAETSFSLWKIYTAFTVAEAIALMLLNMSPFDAICHSFTTMSTGGFSTRDASIAAFDSPAIDVTISVFMLIAAVNFSLYHGAFRGKKPSVLFSSVEFQTLLVIVVIATATITVLTLPHNHGDVLHSLRLAFFQVSTFLSSTGYTTDDYMTYPPLGLVIILFLMLVGGSSGSTAGGIKIERMVLMAKHSGSEIHQSFRPALVQVVRMGRAVVERSVLGDVAAFFVVYMGTLGAGVAIISIIEQISVPATFGAVLSCMSNMGPAPFHEAADNFAAYGPASKIAFSLLMLLGRLEFFTLFALVIPGFWKR